MTEQKIDLKEFEKLQQLLTDKEIPFLVSPFFFLGGREMRVFNGSPDGISVICYDGSYGSKYGLLEVWDFIEEDPEGYELDKKYGGRQRRRKAGPDRADPGRN